jgi:glycosyltransferase involved in cell wall biosynthesis
VHRADPVTALYSSSPPISSHLAAALIASVTNLPWIADFRDPWVDNAFAVALPPPYEWMRGRLERMIVNRAARTVFATPTLRDRYASRYPHVADRFVTVMNGYDRADLAGFRHHAGAPGRPFHLIYTGSVYGERELAVLLDGVERLLARRPSLPDELRIEFVGWFSAENERLAARRFPLLGPVVERSGQVPKEEVLARAASADAGLLLLDDGPDRDLFVGAKLYDYIGLDLPVLAVAPDGDARRVLRELSWGICVDPKPEGVAAGLEQLLAAPPPDHVADPEGRFERRALSRELAALLDAVAG